MTVKEILYFDRPGPKNTDGVIIAVKNRAKELGIGHVVVASTRGETGLKFCDALQGTGVTLVSVSEHAGFYQPDEVPISAENRQALESRGAKVFVGSHALSGVARSITNKFGGSATSS